MSQVNLREPADLRELAADELDIVSGGLFFSLSAWVAHQRDARFMEQLASFFVATVSPSETARLPSHEKCVGGLAAA